MFVFFKIWCFYVIVYGVGLLLGFVEGLCYVLFWVGNDGGYIIWRRCVFGYRGFVV